MNEALYISPALCNCSPEAIGQVVHDAQVTDEQGVGLYSSWWFLDSDGVDLSQHFSTDASGWFHWSIEGRDPTNIFVNVTAGPGYEARVFTPDELLASPTVVLKGATAPPPGNLWPVLALGGLAVVLTSGGGRRSVGKFDPVAKYKGLSPTGKKVVLYGGLAVGAYLAYKFLFAYKPTQQQTDYLNGAKTELARLAAEDGILPSYDNSQFDAWAGSLREAFNDCGTDEATIYRIFGALHNDADLYKLITVCGVLSFKPCLVQGGVYFGNTHMVLAEAMTSELSGSEIDHVNGILSDNSINYFF